MLMMILNPADRMAMEMKNGCRSEIGAAVHVGAEVILFMLIALALIISLTGPRGCN